MRKGHTITYHRRNGPMCFFFFFSKNFHIYWIFGPHDVPWVEGAGITAYLLEMRKFSLEEPVPVQRQGGKLLS